MSLMLVFSLSVSIALYYVWNKLEPTKPGAAVEVTVTKGMSANNVAKLLEEKGIIKDSFIFGYYLVAKKEGSKFQAGDYQLSPGMDKAEVIAKLNSGDVIAKETFTFTIPEGFTVEQIADKLASEGIVNKDVFMTLTNENRSWPAVESTLFIPEDHSQMINRLEGYLFPDTYELANGSTEEEIIIRLLKELDRKLATLPEDWIDELDQKGMNLHELLTLASLVEREVAIDSERATVAGVIYNRLNQPMRLQIDAAIQYALGMQKDVLTHADTEISSPYNTYLIDGLPPGPIASPSLESIKAVLYPEEHDYLYYVTKKDGTQSHLFAKTYNEHLKNIEKSKQTTQ